MTFVTGTCLPTIFAYSTSSVGKNRIKRFTSVTQLVDWNMDNFFVKTYGYFMHITSKVTESSAHVAYVKLWSTSELFVSKF